MSDRLFKPVDHSNILGRDNPYPEDHLRHQEWEAFRREQVRQAEQLWAEVLAMPHASDEDDIELAVKWYGGVYDIRAEACVRFTAPDAVKQTLTDEAEAVLQLLLTIGTEKGVESPRLETAFDRVKRDLYRRHARWIASVSGVGRVATPTVDGTILPKDTSATTGTMPASAAYTEEATREAVGEAPTPRSAKSVPSTGAEDAEEDGQRPRDWTDVAIWFLSETHVQIFVNGEPMEPLNYADLGFADKRHGKGPRRAWQVLQLLAIRKGELETTPKSLKKIEKSVEDARRVLRKRFRLASDPLPFTVRKQTAQQSPFVGYKAAFLIGTRPSYHS